MTAIKVVAAGQLISQIGTDMTAFGLIFWVWQETGQAFDVTLLAAFSFGPLYLLTPLAGALVDRLDRKLVMMASDLAAVLGSMMMLALLTLDRLGVGYLLAITAFTGAFRAFQMPAYGAAVTMMVDQKDYARVSGILSLPRSAGMVVAPVLAGSLLASIGLGGILVIDMLSFFAAFFTLAKIHVPAPRRVNAGEPGLAGEMLFGWRYIRERPPLVGLLMVLFCFNFTLMLPISLVPPMILARTGNDELILGTVQSLLGIGTLTGAMILGVFGGNHRRRVDTLLLGIFTIGALAGVGMGLCRSPPGWYVTIFFGALMVPVVNGLSQAIWQTKVAPGVQGRVFATRRILSQISALPAFLIAGPLADRVFEPAMADGGAWVPVFGRLVGAGPGAGMALIFVLSGVLGMFVASVAFTIRDVRRAEELLPDHESEGSQSVPLGSVSL